jgi:protein adenylyltransferase
VALTARPTAGSGLISALDELPFDNRFTAGLPADPEPANRLRQVYGAAFSRVRPTPVGAPTTLAWSPEMADLLGLDPALCASDDFAQVFAGNRLPAGADPHAHCYGGHQFGSWAGQLGDGRAIALGEVLDRAGGHQTLQLKGSGLTPYSRAGDGRAVLRSSLREFLCSEAMHHLGIPTTRALSLVATGEEVVRDVLYDGHPAPEPGAVVCRVAPSFVRFGSFELPASRGDLDLLGRLVAFTVRADFPHLLAGLPAGAAPAAMVPPLFDEVCARTAALVVDWMRVGFVHGVLNTDNMSILGLTIDYGPYGWLEGFDPDWTPNTTDAHTRRYRYGAQPQVAQWNLLQLASALIALTEDADPLRASLDRYAERYREGFRAMMVERLGWGAPREGDEPLVARLVDLLQRTEVDQVLVFRDLARVPAGADARDDALLAPLADAWYRPEDVAGELRADLVGWLRDWGRRVRAGGLSDEERRRRMDAVNPRFVLRNFLAQEAIDAAEAGDTAVLWDLLDVLRRPYDEQPGRERFSARRPEWARSRVGCSMLSCSS